MKLSTRSDFAFRMILYLLRQREQTKIAEIADFFGISRNHLKVVVNDLSEIGIIETQTGPTGGIQLSDSSHSWRVGDLVTKLEDLDLVECFNADTNTCVVSGNCVLKNALKKANKAFISSLNDLRLQDLT